MSLFFFLQDLASNRNAIALCNNSDLCAFQWTKFIPNNEFDIGNDLGLKSADGPKRPRKLRCGVIKGNRLRQFFGVSKILCINSSYLSVF